MQSILTILSVIRRLTNRLLPATKHDLVTIERLLIMNAKQTADLQAACARAEASATAERAKTDKILDLVKELGDAAKNSPPEPAVADVITRLGALADATDTEAAKEDSAGTDNPPTDPTPAASSN